MELRYTRWSLPVRGAWVEIACNYLGLGSGRGRSPCGERGLKSLHTNCILRRLLCRSPCGERGLKYLLTEYNTVTGLSLPVRGAWVEMQMLSRTIFSSRRRSPCGERGLKYQSAYKESVYYKSLPVRGAWVEMRMTKKANGTIWSLPVRGAWVEIFYTPTAIQSTAVAPRAGSVG